MLFRSPEKSPQPAPSRGVSHLEETVFIQLRRSSSIYETVPWGYTSQPDFLNCVLEMVTTLPPSRLLGLVKGVERELGREWSPRYGPRVIDVDILLWGNEIIDEPDLQVPHPRLHQRAFVLVPLAELAPGLTHPRLGLTITQLVDMADGKDGVIPWGPPMELEPANPPA
jgi:2-amino-4-hydroxy-6-hydroxymethyldihydropteridine diphosphokinase